MVNSIGYPHINNGHYASVQGPSRAVEESLRIRNETHETERAIFEEFRKHSGTRGELTAQGFDPMNIELVRRFLF